MVESVAIITGASQGIGSATAIRLSSSFSAIVLVARNAERLVETANKVKSAGAEALVLALDLARPETAECVVTRTVEEFGRIDAVVHIAGAVPAIDLFEMTDEQWDGGIALKFHAARRLTLHAWDHLKVTHGAVVMMSGNSAEMPTAPYAAVGAINAAIVALAKSFADRGIAEGVRVNSVLPGPVLTDRRRTFIEKWAPAHGMTVDEGMRKFPLLAGISRFGLPEEIADLIAFLVSPSTRWMTGSAIRIDGGEVKGI